MAFSEAATIWMSSSAMNCPNAMIPKISSLRRSGIVAGFGTAGAEGEIVAAVMSCVPAWAS